MLDPIETAVKSLTDKTVIICADDNEDGREMTAHYLREWYEVVTVPGSEELLGLIPELDVPAVILMDMDFGPSDMPGDELITHARQAALHFPVAIIVYSGSCSDESRIQALRVGADGYLVKLKDSWIVIKATIDREIEKLHERIRQRFGDHWDANRDPLTLLLNRRGFEEGAFRGLERAKLDGVPVTYIMGDIDWFKLLNDTRGHDFGDKVLRRVAHCLSRYEVRSTDLVGRYGGEEFCLLFPGIDSFEAEKLVERLDSAVKALRIHASDGIVVPVSISFGAYTIDQVPEGSFPSVLDTLSKEADKAMYAAKQVRKGLVNV